MLSSDVSSTVVVSATVVPSAPVFRGNSLTITSATRSTIERTNNALSAIRSFILALRLFFAASSCSLTVFTTSSELSSATETAFSGSAFSSSAVSSTASFVSSASSAIPENIS